MGPQDPTALEYPAALDAQGKPVRERWVDEPFSDVHDCSEHEDAGDVVFVDEGIESAHWRDFFDNQGRPTRSIGNLRVTGTFTDTETGYQLSYQSAFNLTIDYAARTQTFTGLWYRLRDRDGRILGHTVGHWVSGPDGFAGSGQLDVTLICPFFPQG